MLVVPCFDIQDESNQLSMINRKTRDSAPVTVPWRDGNDRHRIENLPVGEIEMKQVSKKGSQRCWG